MLVGTDVHDDRTNFTAGAVRGAVGGCPRDPDHLGTPRERKHLGNARNPAWQLRFGSYPLCERVFITNSERYTDRQTDTTLAEQVTLKWASSLISARRWHSFWRRSDIKGGTSTACRQREHPAMPHSYYLQAARPRAACTPRSAGLGVGKSCLSWQTVLGSFCTS